MPSLPAGLADHLLAYRARWQRARLADFDANARLRLRGLMPTPAPQRPRETAGLMIFSEVCLLWADRIFRRTHQAATDTTSHASEAPMNAAGMLRSTIEENAIANASMPSAPSTAPAESSAAAFCPRRLPSRPASRLRRISCFSIRVALAQKMAGRAKKRPRRMPHSCY